MVAMMVLTNLKSSLPDASAGEITEDLATTDLCPVT